MSTRAGASRVMHFLALLAAGAIPAGAFAADAPYPTRPVRLVVPFAPGGGVDIISRLLSPKFTEAMGYTWVVDNRPGAAGNIGGDIVAHASPDGHTVLAALNTQLTANPSLYKLSFSVERDLQPVTMLCTAEHILVVHPSVQAKTFPEFIALVKQKPGALNYASAGVGSSLHLAAELLKKRTGIQMSHVAYKGAGPAVAAMLAGETQVLTGTVASTIQLIQVGRLRALASTGAKRSKVLPELPTIAESGYPGFDADAWYALLVPAGTPKYIVDRIRTETLKAIQHPDSQAAMARQGLSPETSTPAELGARIKAETATYAAIIKEAGIKAE
jgi:tripartite-type tricarboxylate transporter receptor subunit TctC